MWHGGAGLQKDCLSRLLVWFGGWARGTRIRLRRNRPPAADLRRGTGEGEGCGTSAVGGKGGYCCPRSCGWLFWWSWLGGMRGTRTRLRRDRVARGLGCKRIGWRVCWCGLVVGRGAHERGYAIAWHTCGRRVLALELRHWCVTGLNQGVDKAIAAESVPFWMLFRPFLHESGRARALLVPISTF